MRAFDAHQPNENMARDVVLHFLIFVELWLFGRQTFVQHSSSPPFLRLFFLVSPSCIHRFMSSSVFSFHLFYTRYDSFSSISRRPIITFCSLLRLLSFLSSTSLLPLAVHLLNILSTHSEKEALILLQLVHISLRSYHYR